MKGVGPRPQRGLFLFVPYRVLPVGACAALGEGEEPGQPGSELWISGGPSALAKRQGCAKAFISDPSLDEPLRQVQASVIKK
jgi:hypothetical protein